MLHGVEQDARIGHFGEIAVEVRGLGKPLPEHAPAVLIDIVFRPHAEQSARGQIEIGQHAVGVEEQARCVPGHQNRAGSSSTGIGGLIGSHPYSRSTSLLSTGLRPGPSDHVM